jgi:hypothetical protein
MPKLMVFTLATPLLRTVTMCLKLNIALNVWIITTITPSTLVAIATSCFAERKTIIKKKVSMGGGGIRTGKTIELVELL